VFVAGALLSVKSVPYGNYILGLAARFIGIPGWCELWSIDDIHYLVNDAIRVVTIMISLLIFCSLPIAGNEVRERNGAPESKSSYL